MKLNRQNLLPLAGIVIILTIFGITAIWLSIAFETPYVYLFFVYAEDGHLEHLDYDNPVPYRSQQRFVFTHLVPERNYRITQQIEDNDPGGLLDGFRAIGDDDMYTSRPLSMVPGLVFIDYCDDTWGREWTILYVVKITLDKHMES